MEKTKKYMADAKGRDVIDSVVEERQYINQERYEGLRNNPGYYGAVSIGCKMMTLDTVRNKKSLYGHSLIEGIVMSAESMKLRDDLTPAVRILTDSVAVHNTHPSIIALIKACVAGSYTVSTEYSLAVSNFAKALMPMVDNLCLPVIVLTSSPIEDEVVAELNDYLKSLCDNNGIRYTEVIETKPAKRKSLRGVLESAEGK